MNAPSSKQRGLLTFSVIVASAVIVLGCVVWFHRHPITSEAQYELGVRYATGKGVKQDDAKAVYWLLKAAEQGYAEAQDDLGLVYLLGNCGLAKDDARAVFWWRKAAEQGNADARYFLGNMYENGTGGLPKDDTQAVSWWRKAADQGYAAAQNNLGVMYEFGHGGLTQDDAQAVFWYQKAADQGNADAKVSIANVRARQSGSRQ